jgi:hypothetical protein
MFKRVYWEKYIPMCDVFLIKHAAKVDNMYSGVDQFDSCLIAETAIALPPAVTIEPSCSSSVLAWKKLGVDGASA